MRPSLSRTAPALWACLLLTGACAEGVGGVELSWAFFDRDLRTAFPRGELTDTCRLGGRFGDETRQYDLNVRLSIYDACDAEQSVADCEPLVRTTFDCNRFRGYLPEVPSSEDPYLMHVDVRVNPRSEPPFSAGAACVAVAGSRERSIRPGRITDLAVYQLVVDALAFDPDSGQLDDRLDLEACEG